MNKSFQIIRTNPRLTTNIKIVVDNDYNLYLESFNSSKDLNDDKFKHIILNTEASIEDEVPKFYDKIPKNIAFSPKNDNDVDIMYNTYENQFDEIYHSGANEVEDQWYSEEFEYFAPLYLQKNNIPKQFIILRVDDPAIYELKGDTYTIGKLTKDNFRSEIIDKWKCVKVFDLTENTNLGKFIKRNITDNNRFPEFSFFFDTKKYNYSKWGGMDYKSGVYTTKELFINDKLYYENNHFEFEQFITKGFEDNNIIYPFIWNFKFLYDDNPATPIKFNKYSSNRYFGFYTEEMELVKILTSYKLDALNPIATIKNNIFYVDGVIANPFVNQLTTTGWVQIDNEIYKINRLSNLQYQIFSNKDLTNYSVSTFNQNECEITYTDDKNRISYTGIIDEYINTIGENKNMYADLYLIDIDGIFHVLKKDTIGYYIQTDYAIISNFKELHYWKGGLNNEYDIKKSILNDDGSPITYKIYRVKFNSIKDFDFDRINTKYADFDYEKYTYYYTPEVKLYANEYLDDSMPIRKKTHDISYDGQYSLMDISSEYIADDEAFEIQRNLKNGNLNQLWTKNQTICKWGYDSSISHSDYTYKLNNSYEHGGAFNRTTNTDIKKAIIKEKSLDYFYRIGNFYENASTIYISEPYISNDWISNELNIWNVYSTYIDAEWDYITPTYLTYLVEPLIIGDEYDIVLSAEVYNNFGGGTVGVDLNSFDDATGTALAGYNVEINVTSTAKSSVFKLELINMNVRITNISITKKIQNKYYLNQSTNIQTSLHKKYDTLIEPKFNLQHYMNSEFDYFDFFFKNIMYYNNNGQYFEKPYLKYSIFGGGDTELPASSLFKGLEYNIYSVDNITFNINSNGTETIKSIIKSNGKFYNGYKMAVILSENYTNYSFDGDYDNGYSNASWISSENKSIAYSNLLQSIDQNGIHVILNEKFKNLLIIINVNLSINSEWGSLNNVGIFGENNGLYYGKTKDNKYNLFPITPTIEKIYNPDNLTANYFLTNVNNLNTTVIYDRPVTYYYIDENGNKGQVNMGNFADTSNTINLKNKLGGTAIWDKKYPPFYIQINTPSSIQLKKKSYVTNSIRGPQYNIYDKYIVYSNNKPLEGSYIKEPLAREINIHRKDDVRNKILGRENLDNYKNINRFVGYYEPIFTDITMFKPTYYWWDESESKYKYYSGNYTFGDDLEQFGKINEMMYSKVNQDGNYLKLRNQDIDKSIYPMVDEIGLSQTERNILLSSWDEEFYIKTLNQQTLLEDYVEIPEFLIIYPSFAAIISVEVIPGKIVSSNYYTGINYYGYNKAIIEDHQTGMTYNVTVRNNSESVKSFDVTIKYSSPDYPTTTELGRQTIILNPSGYTGDEIDVTFTDIKLPYEQNDSSAKEYTLYYVKFDIWDNNENIATDSQVSFNIFNNLVFYSIPTITTPYGITTTYYIVSGVDAVTYNFSVGVVHINPKINSTFYNAKFYISVDQGVYEQIGQTISPGTIISKNGTTTLTFNDVELKAVTGLGNNIITQQELKCIISYRYYIENLPITVYTDSTLEIIYTVIQTLIPNGNFNNLTIEIGEIVT